MIWKNKEYKRLFDKFVKNHDNILSCILTGPPGTGKTTAVIALVNDLQIHDSDFLQINASINNGAETIRETVVNFCNNYGFSSIKIVLFDEAENLTKDAQKMLRGLIQDYSQNVRFMFTCNDDKKILDALKSRCKVLQFNSLDSDSFYDKVIQIIEAEGIKIETDEEIDVVDWIIKKSYPDLRKCINELQYVITDKTIDTSKPEDDKIDTDIDTLVFGYLKDEITIDTARTLINQIPPDSLRHVLRHLYNNVQNLENSDNIMGDVILILSEAEYKMGTKNIKNKLDEDIVVKIFSDNKHTQKQLAERYNVTQSTINHIKKRRTWRWLTQKVS